jgi:hypothetical protein
VCRQRDRERGLSLRMKLSLTVAPTDTEFFEHSKTSTFQIQRAGKKDDVNGKRKKIKNAPAQLFLV